MNIIYQSIIAIFLWLLPLNLQALTYTIHDLGTLATDESYVTGINNQNAIVGYIKQSREVKDFIWEPNKGLIFLPYSSYQFPLINNHNQVAGIFWHKTDHWFKKNTYSKHVYIYHSDGSIQDHYFPIHWELEQLNVAWQTPSSFYEKDLGIIAFNDDQQILVANSNEISKATQFAIWQNGIFKDIDTNVISIAYGINNRGVILGRKWVQKAGQNIPMLVLYNPIDGTITEIMKDIHIINRQLNDQGQVITLQISQDEMICKGSLWDPSKGLIELENFAPLALNNCNQIVGFQISEIQNKKFVPLMWTPDEVISLSQFIELDNIDSIWSEICFFKAINDNGYIIGQGLFDKKKHAFVLIPHEK